MSFCPLASKDFFPYTTGTSMPAPTFGEWVKKQRESQGMSVRALADKVGLSHPRIVQIEGGDDATRDLVRRIADGLNIPRAEAIKIWLEDEYQEGGAITFVSDQGMAEIVDAFERLPFPAKNAIRRAIVETAEEFAGQYPLAPPVQPVKETKQKRKARNSKTEDWPKVTLDNGKTVRQLPTDAPPPDSAV